MSTITAVEAGLYLYGIIDAQDGLDVSMPGIEGGDIETIEADGIAAVVTRVARPKIRPQRANLAVHHKLLHELVQRQAVIPCAFGMVAASEEQLQEVLRANRDELLRQLDRLRGKVEMSLSVYWNTSNIFEFFVATNQELKADARPRVSARQRAFDGRTAGTGKTVRVAVAAVPRASHAAGDRHAVALLCRDSRRRSRRRNR